MRLRRKYANAAPESANNECEKCKAIDDMEASQSGSVRDAGGGYHSWLVGDFEPGVERDIFVAPASNPDVSAVWVDRVFLIPAAL